MTRVRVIAVMAAMMACVEPGLAQGPAAAAVDPDSPPGAAPEAVEPPAGGLSALRRRVAAPPAKQLFGAVKAAAPLEARAIGFYSRGCLAGARPLAIDGPAWQAMRLSRNRNWGHPELVSFIERFALETRKYDGWNGLLVGDMAQPRGGPMLTGHASHQIGLDADIWLTPMPNRKLSPKEREEIAATSMLGGDNLHVDPRVWTPAHVRLIKRAATFPEVERVLVHPGIKQALCSGTTDVGPERAWLTKVRPFWGHFYHFHVRLQCPKDSPGCRPQAPPANDDGCGKELADWFKLLTAPPKPPGPPAPPAPPKPQITLADLPAECKMVLEAGNGQTVAAPPPKKTIGSIIKGWLPEQK